MAHRWMVCSACRKEIPYATKYFACSVSTCNRAALRLVFCSIGCWDSHLSTLRHRDAWAVEERSPPLPSGSAPPPPSQPAPTPTAAPPNRVVVPPGAPAASPAASPLADDDADILIVVSKIKKYIRDRSGMNASDHIAERLSDHLRKLCEAAIRNAALEGRKTVLDRDIPGVR